MRSGGRKAGRKRGRKGEREGERYLVRSPRSVVGFKGRNEAFMTEIFGYLPFWRAIQIPDKDNRKGAQLFVLREGGREEGRGG